MINIFKNITTYIANNKITYSIIAILILILIFFTFNNYSINKRIKKLESENVQLIEKNKQLNIKITTLEYNITLLDTINNSLKNDILILDDNIKFYKEFGDKYLLKYLIIKEELSKYKKELNELKEYPNNRTGNDLINSLTTKLK